MIRSQQVCRENSANLRDQANRRVLRSPARIAALLDEYGYRKRFVAASDNADIVANSGDAAGLVREARQNGIATLELNLEPSHGSSWFNESRHGPATELVPKWVEELLGG